MSKFIRLPLLLLAICVVLASGTAANASEPASGTGYTVEWIIGEKELGRSLEYSTWHYTVPRFGVPVVNKSGNTYVVAHVPTDEKSNSIVCIDRDGKVLWRRDYGTKELAADANTIQVDQEGNLYYVIRQYAGKTLTNQIVHSLTPEGAVRWTYAIAGKEPGSVSLVGNGASVFATDAKVYVLDAKGKLAYTRAASFLTAGHGTIVYYTSLQSNGKYAGNELHFYSSGGNKLKFKLQSQLSFGDVLYHAVQFFSNGDFLVVQGQGQDKKPAVLRMHDAAGKLKWKKVVYTALDSRDVFLAGRNIYLRAGSHFGSTAANALIRLDADTGEEKATYRMGDEWRPSVYAGYNQDEIMGNLGLIRSAWSQDLTQARDFSIYELSRSFKRLDPDTLEVTADYTESLDAYIEATYEPYSYRIVSARSGYAYVYFLDTHTKPYQYYLAKIKLPK